MKRALLNCSLSFKIQMPQPFWSGYVHLNKFWFLMFLYTQMMQNFRGISPNARVANFAKAERDTSEEKFQWKFY